MTERELIEEVQRVVSEQRRLAELMEQTEQILIARKKMEVESMRNIRKSIAALIEAINLPKEEKENLKRVIGA